GWAALNLDESSAFPGWVAAIPVIGSAAVLAAAPGSGRWGPLGLLSTPPARFLGDISYSLYLWHWPLIVIAPAALGAPMDRVHKAGIFALAVLLAWASTRFVEDPLRRGRLLRPTGAALGTAVVGMALTVAAGGLLLGQLPEDRQVELPTATTTCVGPGALDPANKCPSVSGKRPYYPSTVAAMRQNTNEAYPGCAAGMPGHELISCELGAPKKAASATVALIGDSHAKQWFPALDLIGRQRGWHVRTFTKSSCPATYALREVPGETARSNPLDCAAWVRRVVTALTADREVSAVFTAAYSTAYRFHSPADATYADPSVDGFQAVWRELRAAGLPVYVMEEVPRTNGDYVPSCLEELQQPIRCSVPVEEAMPTGRAISSAAAGMGDPGVHLISLRNQFCDDTRCYPVIGGLVVYRDYSHLTRQYAEALVPFISRQLGQEAP
ncbi:MAG: acyltransferase family protein, partial [Nocardioides sp.]